MMRGREGAQTKGETNPRGFMAEKRRPQLFAASSTKERRRGRVRVANVARQKIRSVLTFPIYYQLSGCRRLFQLSDGVDDACHGSRR